MGDRQPVSKADEFAELAKSMPEGQILSVPGDKGQMSAVTYGPSMVPFAYTGTKEHQAPEIAQFFAFCADNRDLISRALRMLNFVDRPDIDLLINTGTPNPLGAFVTYEQPALVLSALREAVG